MDDTLAGKLLVAMPGIGDPRFERTVIMMCEHDARHAMGVVVNKPRDAVSLSDVLGHLGLSARPAISDRAVLDGGPVKPERGFVLHSQDFSAGDATQKVGPGVSLTASRDVLEAVAGENPPSEFVLALGCAGWGAGQLENVLRQHVWLVVDADNAIIFDDDHDAKWDRAIRAFGFDPAQLSGAAGSA